ncbi:MAG TPA: ABC transporter permease [Candidatus Acidoferrales bacterium]|nr:ABC transporter permease [Candidatus Acidoferrales bacterium]
MRKARAWMARMAGLFGRARRERELAAELEAHLALHIEDNVRAGMAPTEARRQALIKLGGLEQAKELHRERRGIPALETLWQDLCYGLRTLRKTPGFTLAAVLTLGLGIGVNTAIFSVVNAALVRPLPYKDASRLILLRETNQRVGDVSVAYLDFLDWSRQSRSFAAMAAIHEVGFDLGGVAQPQRVNGCAVSPNLLSLLGTSPILGRDFLPEESKPGAAPAVILSYKLWQSLYGGRANALGKPLELSDKLYTIVGVLPAVFRLPHDADVLAPIGLWAGDPDLSDRGSRGDTSAIGRLAPGVTLTQARTEMDGIAARLAAEYPVTNSGVGASLKTVRDALVGDVRPAILLVFGAAMLVLLIACVNVAGLYLVRGAARAQEIAVRLTLGATRGRIAGQMLSESVLLAAMGGVAGFGLGIGGVAGLSRLIPPDAFSGLNLGIDRAQFFFVGLLVILVAVGFGLVPALEASRPDVQETLKEGGRGGSAGEGQHRLRNSFAVAQTALALMLLVGAGLMLKSLYRLLQVAPGFQPERVLAMEMDLRSSRYAMPAAKLRFWRQIVERVRALPGVENAAAGTVVPFTGNHDRGDITIDRLPLPAPGEFPHPDIHVVSPGFVSTMGIRLLRGRTFNEGDDEQSLPVALVNSTLVRRFWPGGDAVGKRFLYGHPRPGNRWITIVGVVEATKLYGLANPARFEVYLPMAQRPSGDMNLVVRSAADPASLTSAIRGAIAGVDRNLPIFDVETMNQFMQDSFSTRRFTLILLGLFSALALALAAVGIYGVVSYAAALRTHEIGIRMALGAAPAGVLRLVVGQGARLAAVGVAAGLAGALGLTRLLKSLLFGISASDPATFAAAAALLALVVLAASYVPARRAAKVDPLVALRHE